MNKVAVYGSLRKGLHNHVLLESSDYLGDDKITNFEMYSLGSFPYITPKQTDNKISVEVYEVTPQVFSRLDSLEGYPTFYDRKEVETKHGTCWIYFMNEPYQNTTHPEVKSGDWKNYYKSKY